MAIKYVSEHHSGDDPGGLIREVLNAGDAFQGPAEDIVLSWALRLGDDRDPADCAKRLLNDYGIAEGPAPAGAAGRVVTLLREAATYPQERLHGHVRRGRRRRLEGKR